MRCWCTLGKTHYPGSGHAGPRRAAFPPRRRRYCVLFSIALVTKGTLVFAKACVSEPAGSSRYSRGNSRQVHTGEAARVLEGEHIGGWRQNMTLPASIVEPIAVFMADAPDDCRRCRLGPRPEIDDDVEVEGRVDTVAKVQEWLATRTSPPPNTSHASRRGDERVVRGSRRGLKFRVTKTLRVVVSTM